MKYTTIFEKLLCILDLISKSWIYITFIGIVMFILILLAIKKISKRKCFLLITLVSFILFGYTIYQNFEPLSKITNNLVDNLFTNIYFPSTYAYLFTLITIDGITILNLLNPKIEKIYKTIHGICFIVTNFILTLILDMIAKNNIDIFSKKSLFSNTNLVTLLEFSMNIFIGWIIILLLIYIINIITERIILVKETKPLTQKPVQTIIPEISISDKELKEEYQNSNNIIENSTTIAFAPDTTQNHFIPTIELKKEEIPNEYHFENNNVQTQTSQNMEPMNTYANIYSYQPTSENTFDLSSFIPKKQELHTVQNLTSETNTTQIFEQILNNELPVIHEEPVITEKDTYTLNDYRIFNKMLKDIREHNESNSISIDKNLEYRLITKYSTETYHMFKRMLKIYSN